jgi:hypothetical protein
MGMIWNGMWKAYGSDLERNEKGWWWAGHPNAVPTSVKVESIYLCQPKVVGNNEILLFHILSEILEMDDTYKGKGTVGIQII